MFANVLAVLLALPLVARFVSAQSPSCSRNYTVMEGDTCDGISAKMSVSTYQLAVVNDGVINPDCSNLVPGSSICLGFEGEDCTTTYVVQPNDYCDLVAENHNINTTILDLNNPQLDAECFNLYIGEVVCVAPTVVVPPAPASGTLPGSVIPPTATPVIPWCD